MPSTGTRRDHRSDLLPTRSRTDELCGTEQPNLKKAVKLQDQPLQILLVQLEVVRQNQITSHSSGNGRFLQPRSMSAMLSREIAHRMALSRGGSRTNRS